MNNKLKDGKLKLFANKIEIFDEGMDSSDFAMLRIECFATGDNAHDVVVTESVLKDAEESIYYKPIVWSYDYMFDDASGHDPEEVPCGCVPRNAKISYDELEDGRIMFIVEGAFLWKKYTGRLMEIFERENGKKSVSVEISVDEYNETEDGNIELIDYSYDAITILGEIFTSAIPGAKAEIIDFAEEKKEFKKIFRKEFSSESYKDVDFSIPDEVKGFASGGIALMEENEIDVKPVIVKYCKYLIEEEFISPQKAKYMYTHSEKLMSKVGESEDVNEEYISFMMLGGDSGTEFLFSLVEEMDSIDSKIMSYFQNYRKEESTDMKKKKEDVIVDDKLEEEKENFVSKEESAEKENFKEDDAKEKVKEEDDDAHMADDDKEDEDESDSEEGKEEMGCKEYAFGLTASQIREILNNDLAQYKMQEGDYEYQKYYIETFSGEYIYIYDYDKNCTYRCGYSLDKETKVAVVNMDSMAKVISGGYELVGESGDSDAIFQEYSLDAYLDVPALLGFLKSETEDYIAVAQEATLSEEAGLLVKIAYERMENDAKLIEELTEFKSSVEKRDFDFEVDKTIAGIKEHMSVEEVDDLKEKSKEYTLETIDAWKNLANAFAFKKSKNIKVNDGDKIIKHALPFRIKKESKSKSLWSKK